MPTSAYDPRVHGGDEFPGWSELLHPADADRVRAQWESACGDKAQHVWDGVRHFQTTPQAAQPLWHGRDTFAKWVAVEQRRTVWLGEHAEPLAEVTETLRVTLWMASPDARSLIRDAATMLLEDTDLFEGPAPDPASVAPLVTARALEASNRPSLAAAAEQAGKAAATVARRGWYGRLRPLWSVPQHLPQDEGLALMHEWADRGMDHIAASPWLTVGVASPAGMDLLLKSMRLDSAEALVDAAAWAEAHRLLTEAGLRALRYPAAPDSEDAPAF